MANLPPTHDVEARVLLQIGDTAPVEVGTLTIPVVMTATAEEDDDG